MHDKATVEVSVVMVLQGRRHATRQTWAPRIGDLLRGLSVIVFCGIRLENDVEP